MNPEVEVLAEIPAPEQVATDAPESVATPTPEQTEEQKAQEAAKSKTFTQEELDAAIGKRLAREQRKWERDQQQRIHESPRQVEPKILSIEQFETPEAYADALANVKAHELITKREQERQQTETLETYHDKEESARDKYDDFESVAYNPNVRITDVMAQTIQSSDIGPDVAYFLGSNPKEAERISRLQPFMQAKEIGKIEAQLSAEVPKSKKTTNAPEPINPVKAGGRNTPTYDTTDPRSADKMTTSEWIAAERQRQIAKLTAKR